MPTEIANKVENLIDVGEADQQETEINLDEKGNPEKIEEPKEEKIEVEEVSEVDKTYENERETKLEKNYYLSAGNLTSRGIILDANEEFLYLVVHIPGDDDSFEPYNDYSFDLQRIQLDN